MPKREIKVAILVQKQLFEKCSDGISRLLILQKISLETMRTSSFPEIGQFRYIEVIIESQYQINPFEKSLKTQSENRIQRSVCYPHESNVPPIMMTVAQSRA